MKEEAQSTQDAPLDFVEVPRPGGGAPWRIARRLRPAEGAGAALPGLVWLGGFKSDMQGAKALRVDDWARERGRSCLRFDYSGHGESAGAFEEGAIGDWLEQSLALFTASTRGPQIVVGSSMGAWLALLLAKRLGRGAEGRLKGLVLLAPAVDFTERLVWDTIGAAAQAEIMERGVWLRPSRYSADMTPYTRRLIEEGREHLLLGGSITTNAPVEILQGAADPDVPWRHALTLVEHLAGDPVVFSLIPDGDHRLSREQDLTRLLAAIERASEMHP